MKITFALSVLAAALFVGNANANTLATATASADTIVTNDSTLTMTATGGVYQKKEVIPGVKIATLSVSATGLPVASAGGFTRIEITSPNSDRRIGYGPIAYNADRSTGIWTEPASENLTSRGGKWTAASGNDKSALSVNINAGGDFNDTLVYYVYPTQMGSPRKAGVFYLRFIGSVTHM
ncbi:MAG: hypothetical protein ACRDCY_23135 [Aeromonas veronii]